MTKGAGKKLARLPARACQHHLLGRCLYEERLNPGLHREFRCVVLAAWERVYDEFLDRAESFGLAEGDLSGLWRQRFERLASQEPDCPEYLCREGGDLPDCLRLHEDLCLLRLPECPGHCRHYVLAEKA